MAFYTGRVQSKDLFNTILGHITAVQAGETTAWWKKESSLDSDGVYVSTGSSGVERIVLVFREGVIGQYFITGIAKDYTPGAINTAGAFESLETQNLYYYNTAQNGFTEVTYNLNITKDRIIIHVQGDKLITQWQNAVMYLGMPVRYDVNDHNFIIKVATEQNPHVGTATVIENSIGQRLQEYNWYYINSPYNPSWGNNFFIETLHLGYSNEGLRGELDGLYTTHPNGLVDGDEIEVNGVRYLVVQIVPYGSNGFPRPIVLIKKA